jgi:hypothetical protein
MAGTLLCSILIGLSAESLPPNPILRHDDASKDYKNAGQNSD